MRTSLEGQRHYEITGEKLPSVTTILSATMPEEKKASLAKWKERVGEEQATRIKDQAAERGTIMHHIIESYLKNQFHVDLTPVGLQAHNMADTIIKEALQPKLQELWGLETVLYYPNLYAGQTDVVGIYNDQESICDFKQSNKLKRREWIEDYKLQLAAYALAHNEVYGTNIMQGVNLICTGDCQFQEFVFEGEEFKQAKFEWLRRVDQYYNQRTS